jgi:hypothetical protein
MRAREIFWRGSDGGLFLRFLVSANTLSTISCNFHLWIYKNVLLASLVNKYTRIQCCNFWSYSYNTRRRTFLHPRKIIFILKTRHAISCAAIFYNVGVVTKCRRIGSRIQSYDFFEVATTYVQLQHGKKARAFFQEQEIILFVFKTH